jgi:hypothetical protein
MSRLDRVLPPTVVDSAGKALGSFAALDGSLIYPAVGYLIRRTGDEIYRVPLHYVSPGKMRFSDWVFLYYELPGCSGRMFISATPSAYRTAAAVVPSADGMLGLYASAPNVSASSITTLAVRGPDGTCTVGLSTGMLMEVGLVEDLGYHYDDVFELR